MSMQIVALLFVVFLDVLGQGLLFPIINSVLMDPAQSILPVETSSSMRRFDYGLVIGIFFLSWFLGAAYISKISDYLGRKTGIVICLAGALIGYALTIASFYVESFALLVLGRAISGFTAGNQPIAQAALVDISRNEQEKTRYMGMVVAAMSLGLVAGPIIGGVLSDRSLLGDAASLELPFYFTLFLVLLNVGLILAFFHEPGFKRRPVPFEPFEIFLTLWRAAQRTTVLKLSLGFFFMQLGLNVFYIFMDNYLYSRFKFNIQQNAIAMIVLGAFIALASGFLLPRLGDRFRKVDITLAGIFTMLAAIVVFLASDWPILNYIAIAPFALGFGLAYPTVLALFSASVDETEQGWVMGVSIALFTLSAGINSLIGGMLMTIDIRLPMYQAMGGLIVAAAIVLTLWRGPDVRALEAR